MDEGLRVFKAYSDIRCGPRAILMSTTAEGNGDHEAFTVGMGREAGIGRLRDSELHGLVDFRARGVP